MLNELKVPIAALAPEPATWREVIRHRGRCTLGDAGHATMRLAVQEYGASNPGVAVGTGQLASTPSPSSRSTSGRSLKTWSQLRNTVDELLRGTIDVVLFMTAVQVIHLFQVAEDMAVADELRRAPGRCRGGLRRTYYHRGTAAVQCAARL